MTNIIWSKLCIKNYTNIWIFKYLSHFACSKTTWGLVATGFWFALCFVSTNAPNICPLFSANSPLTVVHFSLQISPNFEKKPAQEGSNRSHLSHIDRQTWSFKVLTCWLNKMCPIHPLYFHALATTTNILGGKKQRMETMNYNTNSFKWIFKCFIIFSCLYVILNLSSRYIPHLFINHSWKGS